MKKVTSAIALIASIYSYGQADSSLKVFAGKLHYGAIYVHTSGVKNVAGARPRGFEVEYSKQKINQTTYNLCNCYPRSGVVASYYNFNTPILGWGAILGYFLEPTYRLSNRLKFYIRGTFGIDYLSDPYNSVKHPQNHSYTLHINPFMQLGGGIGYSISNHAIITAGTTFQHTSNGAFKEPNRGVNWITGSFGLLYSPGDNTLPKYHRTINKFWKGKKPAVDLGFFYVPKQGYNSIRKATRNYVAGSFIQITKQIGRTSALTGGVEIFNSEITEATPTPKNLAASKWFAGIHAGHAFLLGRVTFKQQLGIEVFDQTTYFKTMYYRIGLDYRLGKHILIGVNLKAFEDTADFADARIMYRL